MAQIVKYEQALPWMKVTVGGRSHEELIEAGRFFPGSFGYKPHDAKDLIRCSAQPTKKRYVCELVALMVTELGFREEDFPEGKDSWSVRGPTYKQTCERALQLGFKLCTPEIVASACASAEFSYGELHRTRGATFGMKPVVCSDWKAKVLRIYEDNDPFSRPELFAYEREPVDTIAVNSGFIFSL